MPVTILWLVASFFIGALILKLMLPTACGKACLVQLLEYLVYLIIVPPFSAWRCSLRWRLAAQLTPNFFFTASMPARKQPTSLAKERIRTPSSRWRSAAAGLAGTVPHALPCFLAADATFS